LEKNLGRVHMSQVEVKVIYQLVQVHALRLRAVLLEVVGIHLQLLHFLEMVVVSNDAVR